MVIRSDMKLETRCRGICRRFGIQLVTQPTNKLRSRLVHPKDPITSNERQGVVYAIKCSDDRTYVGETGRLLAERTKEHKREVRNGKTDTNPIAEHVLNSEVAVDWNVRVLAQEHNWFKRRVHEALWIGREGTLNRDCGLEGVANFWSGFKHNG